MGADPKPSDLAAIQEPERPISERDADRVNRLVWVNPFEVETGMRWIVLESGISLSSDLAYFKREFAIGGPKARSRS